MDGILLIDKPSGPTSHDVVARLRRTTGERRIGHTGTLDPLATGLLILVLGRATRLAAYLSQTVKTYEATVRLGFATDTDDAEGEPIGPTQTAGTSDPALTSALEAFRGVFNQVPPIHSAKKIAGTPAYALARRSAPVALAPVSVTVLGLELVARADDLVMLRVTATAGFYVRALARDLGVRLGCGAHLAGLRRTACGRFGVEGALTLARAEVLGQGLEAELVSPADALADLAAVRLTPAGQTRAIHGNPLGPGHIDHPGFAAAPGVQVRLLDDQGRLVAIAAARGGALHPVVVLG